MDGSFIRGKLTLGRVMMTMGGIGRGEGRVDLPDTVHLVLPHHMRDPVFVQVRCQRLPKFTESGILSA